jgi:hypothetical protein
MAPVTSGVGCAVGGALTVDGMPANGFIPVTLGTFAMGMPLGTGSAEGVGTGRPGDTAVAPPPITCPFGNW